MTHKRNYGVTLFMIFLFLTWTAAALADITGKVVAVVDGDTVDVLQ